MANPLTPLTNAIRKMWRGPRTGPEGSWQTAYGMGELGGIYEIPFGDGFQRNLSAGRQGGCLVATACINTYVGALASSGLDHIRHLPQGGIEVIKDSAVAKALRYPNFLQQQSQWLAYIVSSLAATGNFYVYAAERDERNVPISLIPLSPHSQRAVLSDDRSALWYDVSPDREFFTAGNTDMLVPARDVAHGKLSTHRSLLVGDSPLAEAGYTLSLNQGLLASASEFIRNMARPSGIIAVKDTLTGAQMAELREKFHEVSRGTHVGKVPILGSDAKWQPLTISAVDAQIMQLYGMTVLDICRAYRVPPQLLGMENNGTASSVETLINQWRATGLLYYAETIERTLERFFQLPPDEEIRFDLDNIARADFKTLIETLASGVQNAVFSPNEARGRVGLAPVPFGDSPRIQAQNVRLQDAVPAPSAPSAPVRPVTPEPPEEPEEPEEPEDDPEEMRLRLLSEDEREVLAYAALTKAMQELGANNES